jgi:acyl-CoA synthetase (AMP-forming)/AMP-acid ligase II
VPDTAERTAHIFTFDGYLRFWAEDRPGRVALDTADAVITFAELDRMTVAIAAGLADLGIATGDRIAWQGHDAGQFFALLFAAARSGVVMVPIAPDHPPDMARAIAEDAGAKAVFLGPAHGGHGHVFAGLCGLVRCFDADAARRWIAGLDSGSFPLSAPNAAVLQIYEERGRDDPRGVVLSHCNLLALRKAVLGHTLPHVVPGDDETMLVAMPCWRIGGIGPVVMALAAGLPVAIRDVAEPCALIAALAGHKPTRMYIAPDALARLLTHPEATHIARGQVRYVACGPRPVPTGLRRAVRARLGATLIRSYGLPETAGTIAMLAPEDRAGASAVGRPLPGVEIRVIGADGAALPPGTAGTVQIRSASVMLGYWNQPQATAAALTQDGWVVTGDRGHLDSGGILHLI